MDDSVKLQLDLDGDGEADVDVDIPKSWFRRVWIAIVACVTGKWLT